MPATAASTPTRQRIFRAAVLLFLMTGAVETLYYASVYLSLPANPPPSEMVLIYSGPDDRTRIFRDWTGPRPLFLFSGRDYTPPWRLKEEVATGQPFMLENQAQTTDQNARYCAPLVRKTGVHSVVLALPWYHLPRALLLTRYYLRGSGITVEPYATTPLPWNWFLKPLFFGEMAKFWGSLLRIALSWAGIQNWPPPSGSTFDSNWF